MDLVGIGGLASSSGSMAIPVLKKAMQTQENLAIQMLEEILGASSQPSVLPYSSVWEAATAMGRGTSLDVRV